MDQLGYALLGLGLFGDARPLHEEALERIEDSADESHPLLPDVLTNLAYASTRKGDLVEAEQLLTRALRVVEKDPAARSALANRIRINLAKEVYNRTGREDEAARLLYATLERSRRLLGPDHTETNSVLIWLSRVLRSQGRTSEAVDLLREAAANCEQVRGIERSDPLHVIGELAELLESLGRCDDAIRTLEDGLARAIRAHGEEHAETARWIYKLANIVTAAGDYERAAEVAERALRIRQRIYGPDHEIVAESLQQLGWTLACAGKFEQALAPYRRALDVNRTRLGPAHRETARSAVTLSFALFFAGQANAGVDLLRRTYGSLREDVGETHATAMYAARFLSRLLGYHGRYDEAIELCERLEAAAAAKHGGSDARVALWQVQRGWHLYNSGNAPAAVQALQSALSSYEALDVGRAAPSDATLFTMHRLSEALTLHGDAPQAERLARTAWTGLRDKYGEAHRRGALARCALGRAILAQGRPDEAEAILRECVATLASLPGPHAYRLVEDAYAIHLHARALMALGRSDEGEQRLRESCESICRFRTKPFVATPAAANSSDTRDDDAPRRLVVFP
jgi:tetratricopeptide (TPR) repeat protein